MFKIDVCINYSNYLIKIKNSDQEKTTDPDDPKNNAEIENVVENLLIAINDDQDKNMEDEKNKIITQYYQDDDIVDLEIDDWLIMDQ